MKLLYILFSLFLFTACSENDDHKSKRKMTASFDKEIGSRIKLLNNDTIQTDSLKVNPNEVDSIVNTLILLSKDVENMQASVIRSNQYFDGLASRYGISTHEFEKIKVRMQLDDVAAILKDNELKFFNMILLKNNRADLLLHAAE
ncbi:MAG: hypothetical protein H0W73_19000 [Bacteroidetes bacterium]|nr:hypothetical protein [Bacteroidota bacterium]